MKTNSMVALMTTYHSPDRGKPTTLSLDDLAKQTIIAQPAKCMPLAVPTSVPHVTTVMSWWGTVGDQAQWVSVVTVSFSSAAEARRALLSKRVALGRCHLIRMTFPPFDELSELYRVSDNSPISPLRWNRVRYNKSSTVRAQAVDTLVARLRELELAGS
jgi:hypothetical protein